MYGLDQIAERKRKKKKNLFVLEIVKRRKSPYTHFNLTNLRINTDIISPMLMLDQHIRVGPRVEYALGVARGGGCWDGRHRAGPLKLAQMVGQRQQKHKS